MAMEYRAVDAVGVPLSDWFPQRSEAEEEAGELIAAGEIDAQVERRVVSPAVCCPRSTSKARRQARRMVSAPMRQPVRRRHLSLVKPAGE